MNASIIFQNITINFLIQNKLNKKIVETGNMIIVSRLIIWASLNRKKSVGTFYVEN